MTYDTKFRERAVVLAVQTCRNEAARRLGVSPTTVSQWMRDAGVDVMPAGGHRMRTEAERAAALEAVASGERVSEAAERSGVAESTLRRWCEVDGRRMDPARSVRYGASGRARAVEMAASGMEPRRIAEELGCHRTTVVAWLKAAGVELPRPKAGVPAPVDVRSRGVELVVGGSSYAAAAAELGVSRSSVVKWCRDAGVRSEARGLYQAPRESLGVREQAVDMVRRGASCREAGEAVGFSTASVAKWCREAGVVSTAKPGFKPGDPGIREMDKAGYERRKAQREQKRRAEKIHKIYEALMDYRARVDAMGQMGDEEDVA